MKKILVPVDYSNNAAAALRYANEMATVLNAEIHLLYVAAFIDIWGSTSVVKNGKTENANLLYELKQLKNWAKDILGNKSRSVNYIIKSGIPEIAINKTAAKLKATLIVMGRTGNGMLQRMLMGSTVANVLSQTKTPVMIIPEGIKPGKIKRVAFATDLNPKTLAYVNKITPLLKHYKAELMMVYVYTGSVLNTDVKIKALHDEVQKRVTYKNVNGYFSDDVTIRQGMTSYLKDYKTDLLVTVTHHRSFLQMLWKRSITQKLSSALDIPLLALVETKKKQIL